MLLPNNGLHRAPVVFLSYAHADSMSALAIDQWLRNRGARVLLDTRDFIPGQDIEEEIVRCVRTAGRVVCLYSESSADRPYVRLNVKSRRCWSIKRPQDA